MILRFLDTDKSVLGILTHYGELSIESSTDFSDKTLTMECLEDDVRVLAKAEGYIVTTDDRFVIKEIESQLDGTVKIVAQLDLETLEGKSWYSFETVEQTIDTALALAFSGTGWTVGTCDITKRRTIRMTNTNSLEVLKQALSTYRCEIEIDSLNQKINVKEKIGSDKGVYFMSSLNLKALTTSSSSYDYYTEIEPYGKDGLTISRAPVEKTVSAGSTYTYTDASGATITETAPSYVTYETYDQSEQRNVTRYAKAGQRYEVITAESTTSDVLNDDGTVSQTTKYKVIKRETLTAPTSYTYTDYETINGGKGYIANYTYSDKKKRYIWKDERYTVVNSLIEDATAKLEDMAKPYVSYQAEIIDLASISGKYSILDYSLGDMVTLIDSDTGTRETQRIVGMKVYPDEPEKNTATLANKTLTFDEMVQKYADTSNTVENITSDNGTVDGSTVDAIQSSQIIDLENAIVKSMEVVRLTTQYLWVSGKLTAAEADIGKLTANEADFENVTADNINALKAAITEIQTSDLTAANAKIDDLEANFANIQTLLSGNAGTGNLQTIALTAANATIDSALINKILASNAYIQNLTAGNINTDQIKISSTDGALVITGATETISDENGNVRIQFGKDATGNFNFQVYDETGSGLLMDAGGIKGAAISDGLIVDKMVSDDAAIQAQKLDIDSLFKVINEDGSNTIQASKVHLNESDQTLEQAYTNITSSVTDIQSNVTNIETGLDGIKADIKNTQTQIEGISDGNLVFQTPYTEDSEGNITFTAAVLKNGVDCRADWPEEAFTWFKRSEDGDEMLGNGYSTIVNKAGFGYGCVVVGRFDSDFVADSDDSSGEGSGDTSGDVSEDSSNSGSSGDGSEVATS